MESIDARSFDNLKLIVELDFSWNKLGFVPLPQIKHLALMRRLTMRGNPLYALDELTFSGGLSTAAPGNNNSPEQQRVNIVQQRAEASDSSQTRGIAIDLRNMSRLYETYPELARSFVRQRLQSLDPSDDNNLIIKGRGQKVAAPDDAELEMLQHIVLLNEPDGEFQAMDSVEHLDGPMDGGDGIENASKYSGTTMLGDHFNQLQELDFGQCKLNYIKWTTLEHLNQLKRLLLDGNQLR